MDDDFHEFIARIIVAGVQNVWATEKNRRARLRDAAAQYKIVQDKVDALRQKQTLDGQANARMRLRRSRNSGFLVLRRQNLAAAVHAGLEIDMVRTTQLAGILVFHIGRGRERIGGAAEAALHRRGFSFRNGHRISLGKKAVCEPQGSSEVRKRTRLIQGKAGAGYPKTPLFDLAPGGFAKTQRHFRKGLPNQRKPRRRSASAP
jgi:hypothetical protein